MRITAVHNPRRSIPGYGLAGMIYAEMPACFASASLTRLIKLHNRSLKSFAVLGHEKPPKVVVQLSGCTSKNRWSELKIG